MSHQQERAKFEIPSGMTLARIRKSGLDFEILVNLDVALKFKKGLSDYMDVEGDKIFSDIKKGNVASKNDLELAFKTNNVLEIGKIIVKEGEVLVDQEHRDEEKERKIKQVVDFLSKNALDPQTGNPISSERIKNALHESHANIKNVPVENQIKEILESISRIIPIKIQTKKIKIKVPAIQTGKVYGLISQYKERENWLSDGSLEVVVSVPAGIILDFYDKLNSMTHGSALTEEVKE